MKVAKGKQHDALNLTTMSKHHTDGIKMANNVMKMAEHQ